ncbi:hypothetical protein NC652_006351 [Populus alba x Populus x berolinensis]|nr:hypothetical protein NC652_006351 [Populus alba x Populus x berolinensis]
MSNYQCQFVVGGGWWVEILGHLDGVSAWLREESNKNKTLWKQKLRTSGGAVQLSQSNQRSLRKKNLFL